MASVKVYGDANYGGAAQELSRGQYDMGQLTVGNDAISSLQVPPGWTVTLYENAGYQGRSKTFTSDTPYVGNDFNDLASSITVQDGAPAGDTTNALTDFDLCLALAQRSIDSQMEYAWRAWKRRKNFSDTLRVFKTRKGGQLVEAKTGIEAVLAPLTVSLNVPDGKLGQVKVTLHLRSGTVTYVDEEAGGFATHPIRDWSVSFISDLDRRPVDLDILAQIDPDTHQTAAEVIAASGLPDAVFSIEYLFLKFTDVDLILADNKDVAIPADVPSAARDKALSSLNFLLQGELGEFLLGTVVRRNNKQATPTFAMTDFIFDVHPDSAVADASTLAYLGMFSRRALPADQTAARLKLTDAWVRPEQIDGTVSLVAGIMAIRKGAFMDDYLIKAFTQRIGRPPAVANLTWTFADDSRQSWKSRDIIDREWDKGRRWNLAIAIAPGTNKLYLSGRVSSHAKMDGYTLTADFGAFGKAGHYHTEWIHMEGHQDLAGSVTLTGGGIGTGFNLVPAVEHGFRGLVVDNESVEGGAQVLTAFEDFFTGKTTAEALRNQQQGDVNNLSTWLDQVLRDINLDLSQHAFIPPGGGVFTFQNPRFSRAGDLIFDVIYQGP
jgi:hypothetical protein